MTDENSGARSTGRRVALEQLDRSESRGFCHAIRCASGFRWFRAGQGDSTSATMLTILSHHLKTSGNSARGGMSGPTSDDFPNDHEFGRISPVTPFGKEDAMWITGYLTS